MLKWKIGAWAGLALVMIGVMSASEPAAPPAAAVPKPEIALKVRVYYLKSSVAEVNAEPDEKGMKKMVEEINRIWAPAGIRFVLDSVKRVDARDEEAQREYAKLCGQKEVVGILARLLTRMIPEIRAERAVFPIVFVKKFPSNFGGRYFPEMGMIATPQLVTIRRWNLPADKEGAIIERALEPKVMAHELGHALSLMHVNLEENLMWVGKGGPGPGARDPKKWVKLTEGQIADARKIATAGKPFAGKAEKQLEKPEK